MGKIVLHLGTYKTGSTAIQQFMRQNDKAFRKQGIVYPLFPKDGQSHTFLRQTIYRDDPEGLRQCLEIMRRAFQDDPDATIVLSSEHFWPMNGPRLHAFLDALQSVSSNVHTLIYLRRQDHLWASLYAQQSKGMGVRPEHQLWGKKGYIGQDIAEHGMYYFEVVEEYARRFGRERVAPRVYDRKLFTDGDVVKDFVEFVGGTIPDPARDDAADTNQSFGWKAVEFSKYCAVKFGKQRYKNDPAPAAMRRAILRLAREDGFPEWFGKAPNYLSLDEQKRIIEHYRPSNEKLFEAYFSGRDAFANAGWLTLCPYSVDDIPDHELKRAFEYMALYLSQVTSGEAPDPQREAAA